MIEVEVKLALTDSKRVEQKLRKDGFVLQKIVRETDTYFNGVDRDFRKTDEALRVRKNRGAKECNGFIRDGNFIGTFHRTICYRK